MKVGAGRCGPAGELGCDPGYFRSWRDTRGGPFWSESSVGDEISVWIVDVDGTRLFIASEIHRMDDQGAPLPDGVTTPELLGLQDEMEQIVDSIEFE